jgi:RNA polymerase sigma-70 factor, ECF subfamily
MGTMNRGQQHRRGCRYGARDGRESAPGGQSGRWTKNSASGNVAERELLEAARNGDEDAFRHLVESHRTALLARCYRMLGSLDDAEDALQETLVRAWRGLSGFDGRSALRTWLYRIATNACLDAMARRPKRVLPIDFGPRDGTPEGTLPTDALWMEQYSDQLLLEDGYAAPAARYEQREAVELAFVMAFHHLSPRQRVVLVLRDVLGFSANEVSQWLGTTVASVNGALHRARKAVDERVPEKSQQATVRALGDVSVHGVVERLVDALERADVEAIVALLAEDARFALPPYLRRRTVTPTIPAPRTVSLPRFELPSARAA